MQLRRQSYHRPRSGRSTRLRVRAAGVVAGELDSLRERQLSRKVNRVRLTAHITFPGIAAALASAAGIFLAAKRAADLRPARAGVDVSDSTIAPDRAHEFLRFA